VPARRVAAVLVGALLWGRGAAAPGADAPRDEAARLAKVHAIPEVPLAEGVRLGGLSDLTPERQSSAGRRFWTLTDRGPNGIVDVEGEKLRTIEAAAFTPTLVLVELPPPAGGSAEATIVRTIPLATPSGRPLSGRPPPGLRDDPIVDPRSRGPVAADPDGVDSEGVVEMADGTFWIAEEYGPSLVHVAASGRVIDRFFPTGAAPAGSVSPAHDPLPAHYAARRENRGFEALAAAPDAALLFVLLQSPLDHPAPKAAKKTGNVRLLVFDPARGLPVAEHVYRLGDPQDPDYLTRGAPPDDGKLCAMASIDPATLLVLEQSDGGLARLYAATLEAATDTLRPRASAAADGKTLEQVRDLAAAGIVPIHKRLVADLGELLPEIEAAVYGGPSPAGKLKLEGLAILDERTIVIVNDNDFGVHARKSGAAPRSCLFVIELATPLPGGVAVSPRAAQNADE
jgi:hypothetical protein